MINKKCISCKITKDIILFKNNNSNQCKKCQTLVNTNRINNNSEAYFKKLFHCAKSNAKARSNNNEFLIKLEDIINIYKIQEGKCYYSKITMVLKIHSHWQCSLERLDPSKGYTIENIALIVCEFQSANQWSINKFNEFKRLLTIKHEDQIINWNIEKKKSPKKTTIKYFENGIQYCVCNKCQVSKSIDMFNKDVNRGCKNCVSRIDKIRNEVPIRTMQLFLSRIKTRSKKKNLKETDITIKYLTDLFDSQNGLCAYSKIPMSFGSYYDKWWKCSIERKDVNQGYTQENICFICYEFNTASNLSRSNKPEEELGHSGWSIEKINYIKELHSLF